MLKKYWDCRKILTAKDTYYISLHRHCNDTVLVLWEGRVRDSSLTQNLLTVQNPRMKPMKNDFCSQCNTSLHVIFRELFLTNVAYSVVS